MEEVLKLIQQLQEEANKNVPTHQLLLLLKQIEIQILSIHFSNPNNSTSTDSNKEIEELKQEFEVLKINIKESLQKFNNDIHFLKNITTKQERFSEENFFSFSNDSKENATDTNIQVSQENIIQKEESVETKISKQNYVTIQEPSNENNIDEENNKFKSNAIDLNQKILYIQKLFHGNSEEFKSMVNTLLVTKTKEETIKIIEEQLSPRVKTNLQANTLGSFQKWILERIETPK